MLGVLGIEEALKKEGASDGDTVHFNDWELAWYD